MIIMLMIIILVMVMILNTLFSHKLKVKYQTSEMQDVNHAFFRGKVDVPISNACSGIWCLRRLLCR